MRSTSTNGGRGPTRTDDDDTRILVVGSVHGGIREAASGCQSPLRLVAIVGFYEGDARSSGTAGWSRIQTVGDRA